MHPRQAIYVLRPYYTVNQKRLTCYCLRVTATFPARDEHDIALASVDVFVFEYEELVDSVFLESGDLDYYANWANQTSIEDDILLAADLSWSDWSELADRQAREKAKGI